ncbi:MAG: sulfotransferase domain-containing protein [bacterium]
MKNYILHIGLPKTGTTAIQKHFFSRLNNNSTIYNPLVILNSLKQAIKLVDFDMFKEDDIELLKNVIENQEKKIKQKNILISLETLSLRMLRFDYKKRLKFIKAIFPNARIIIVLRHQESILRSLYQQHVYQNYFLNPKDVFLPFSNIKFAYNEKWKRCMQIDINDWNYVDLIKEFSFHYKDKLSILFYENYKSNITNIGSEILKIAGIKFDNSSDINIPRTNISYDLITMFIVIIMAKHKIAFRSNYGYDSKIMNNLLLQARKSRSLYDNKDVDKFINNIKLLKNHSKTIYSKFDKYILKIIRYYSRICSKYRFLQYKLPKLIRNLIKEKSRVYNKELEKMIDKKLIPSQYLN